MSDDVIARKLWFAPQPIKNPGYAYEHARVNKNLALYHFKS